MRAELLAPAGDEEAAYVALQAGADAVYLGLTRFSARAGAENFDLSALCRVMRFAHVLGAKVYVALNTLVKDSETDEFFASAVAAWNAGADALLIQDIFLGRALKETYPQMVLHLSTQGGCCNRYGAEVAKEYGFSRAVLARETPIGDIAEISSVIETEVFVQGALCTCFSGQCYLSSFAGNHSGNRGKCKQPCRKLYKIDRMGYEKPAYALSLSDLCAGEKIEDFLRAGAVSLKIEGRMRRPEYIAAAVKYYRALLDGGDAEHCRRDLMRAFNRGDYTRGLAFGQKKDLLSRDVQGHIGERVGEISLEGGAYLCKSEYTAGRGDGFKILRGGKEVGGAAFLSPARGGFLLASDKKLLAGDEVRLTTDASAGARLFSDPRRRKIAITLRFFAGERPRAVCENFVFEGEGPLPAAKNAPLKKEALVACFQKTDGAPLAPDVTVETDGVFLPVSALNAFRRAFYGALLERLGGKREPLAVCIPQAEVVPAEHCGLAAIAEEETCAEITVVKPRDYARIPRPIRPAYLYLPPFFTAKDFAEIDSVLPFFEGIYCEGSYGIALARKYKLKLFAGTGFNITNRYAVCGIREAGAAYFALSKEISRSEQERLASEGAFALSHGAVKVMDLCYCPFGRTCSSCDRRDLYTLTDGDGRAFPLRRYRMGGVCRFEVYNCAPLAAKGGASPLVDGSLGDAERWVDLAKSNESADGATHGHAERSFL